MDETQLFGLAVAMNPKINSATHDAHLAAADKFAIQYVGALYRDTDATLGTAEEKLAAFRFEWADEVARQAHVRGAYRAAFRPELFLSLARAEIKKALTAKPELVKKLLAIRATQQSRRDSLTETEIKVCVLNAIAELVAPVTR